MRSDLEKPYMTDDDLCKKLWEIGQRIEPVRDALYLGMAAGRIQKLAAKLRLLGGDADGE